MKWSRSELKGTGSVFRFSLIQQLKGRMNVISFFILFLLAAGSVPVMALKSGGTSVETSGIKTVYVENDTAFPLDFESVDGAFAETLFVSADFSLEEYETVLPEDGVFAVIASVGSAGGEDTGASAAEVIGEDTGTSAAEATGEDSAGSAVTGFAIDLYTLETSKLDEEDLNPLEQVLEQKFNNARIEAAGASAGQLKRLETAVETRVVSEADYRNPEKNDWETRFALQYAYAIIVMMLCLMTSSYIVRAIAEEKSSKLVELLMVSVRPLALLLGKILAMMVYMLLLFGTVAFGFAASWFVTGRFLDLSSLNAAAVFGIDLSGLRMGAGLGAVMVVSVLLGYLTFSLVAGVTGCCCESMDDVEGANMKVVLLVMAGYLISCVASAFTSGPVCVISSLFPLVSVFCAPVQYVLGNVGLGVLSASWLIQLAVIAGLAVFSARVYNDLIIHRGSRIGFRQLLSMAGKGGGAQR